MSRPMTNKQALREAAQEEIMLRSVSDTSDAWQDLANPATVLALLDELEAKDKRIAELERGSKVIKCWSCQKSVTVDQVTAVDGYCPLCDCGIDLEEYETEELAAAGILIRINGEG